MSSAAAGVQAREPARTPGSQLQLALHGLGHEANGRLLLTGIKEEQQRTGSERGRRPRGWLASEAAPAAGGQDGAASAATGSISTVGINAAVIMQDLHRMFRDPTFADVPVPTVYIGKLAAAIPAGRPTLDGGGLLKQLQEGKLPSDGLQEGDREVWRAVSRVTDPISAFNICQAQQLGGRKLILTQRGVAEKLARGTIQMVAVEGENGHAGGSRAGFNPLAPLQKLVGRFREGQRMARKVEERAAALEGHSSSKSGSGSSSGSSVQMEAGGSQAARPASQPAADEPAPERAAGAAVPLAVQPAPAEPPQQYSLQEVPPRRQPASGTPPQLAWMPLRVALQLLRSLPQHFVLLADSPQQRQEQQAKQQEEQQLQEQHPGATGGGSGGSSKRASYTTVTNPGGLEVHIIPGLHIRQVTPEGGSVEFIPAFISHSQVHALWRDVREISGGAMLMYRKLERSLMRRRLENAAALIARGGRGRGPQAGSGSGSGQDDDDEGGGGGGGGGSAGMDEPPEIQDFIRELGGSLAQEAAAAGGGMEGGGMQAPSGLPRLAATFACGVVSLAAQGLSWAGNTSDWLMMSTPLGPRLLGVPQAGIEHHRLSDLVASMQQYNKEQAVVNARFGLPPHALLADDQQLQQILAEASADCGEAAAVETCRCGMEEGEAAVAAAAAAAAAVRRQEQQVKQQQQYAESAAQYSRTLAAAAIWLAVSSKSLAEDPEVAGLSLGRLLTKAFVHQSQPISLGAAHRVLPPTPGARPQLPTLPPPSTSTDIVAVPSSLQEAMEQALASGLPLLEHNGFQVLFDSCSGSGSGGGGNGGVAGQVARHCTGDTHLGLAAFVKDSTSGGFSMTTPLGPLPAGRGLLLVGDLDLKPRQRGRTTARTTVRWLTVGVDDGRKLL